jgi:hypothetical protein
MVEVVESSLLEGCSTLTNVAFESESQLRSLPDGLFKDCHDLKSIWLPSSIESLKIGGLDAKFLPGLEFESPSHLDHLSMILYGRFEGGELSIPDSVTVLHFELRSSLPGSLVLLFGRDSRLRFCKCVPADLRRPDRYSIYHSRFWGDDWDDATYMWVSGALGVFCRFCEPSLKRMRDAIEF